MIVDIDEGKQFFVSDIHVLAASSETAANLLRDAPLQRGQVYNQRLAEFFFTQGRGLLPHGVSPASRIHLDLDERMGTLGLTYDLRECGQSVANFGAPRKDQ